MKFFGWFRKKNSDLKNIIVEPIIFKDHNMSKWHLLGWTDVSYYDPKDEKKITTKMTKIYFFINDNEVRSYHVDDMYNIFKNHSYVKHDIALWVSKITNLYTPIDNPSVYLTDLALKEGFEWLPKKTVWKKIEGPSGDKENADVVNIDVDK